MTSWEYGILAAAILLCAAAVWCERRKTRRTLEKLNEMLTDAMRGDFTEDSFDETLLSALESKLAHYLAASTVSARNVSTEKEKLKTLIGDISHQTKTPIANILLYAQLLREQPGNGVCLDAQTRKLQSLIEALVKTSRLESGVIALRPEPGALQDVLSSAVSQLEPKAGEKGISITFLPTDAEAVFDAKWTEEAVFNLLDNAVKYTPAGGSCVRVRLPDVFCHSRGRQRVGDPGGRAAEGISALLPGLKQSHGGRRGHRAVSGASDRRGAGRLCEGQLQAGRGQHLLPVPPPGNLSTLLDSGKNVERIL